jgi:DNA topoisomerase-1
MADSELEKTVITIGISDNKKEEFLAKGEVIKFDGFLKVYMESIDEDDSEGKEGILPSMSPGNILNVEKIVAQEKFSQQPIRFTEAMLVKKLEELGIGRPSTYAPIISTIQKRGYVIKEDRPGSSRNYTLITLRNQQITEDQQSEKVGFEKAKLFPTDIGNLVNGFLVQHFTNILDYNFTASVEEEFDEIAEGKLVWNQMISDFYFPFHDQIEGTLENTKKISGEKLLGIDPVTGANVFVKIGRYGPMVQLGNTDSVQKPKFAALKKGQSIDTITLEEAMDLFKLPRKVGEYDGSEVIVSTGRFGPYLRYKSKFYSLPKEYDPLSVPLEHAIDVILKKQDRDNQKILKEFQDNDELIQVLNGRYGSYISYKKQNYRIPKETDARLLTLEECRTIIANTQPSKSKKKK